MPVRKCAAAAHRPPPWPALPPSVSSSSTAVECRVSVLQSALGTADGLGCTTICVTASGQWPFPGQQKWRAQRAARATRVCGDISADAGRRHCAARAVSTGGMPEIGGWTLSLTVLHSSTAIARPSFSSKPLARAARTRQQLAMMRAAGHRMATAGRPGAAQSGRQVGGFGVGGRAEARARGPAGARLARSTCSGRRLHFCVFCLCVLSVSETY